MSMPPFHHSGAGGGHRTFFTRRKSCPFSSAKSQKIDYKDTRLLQRYTSERGKIVPSRISSVSTKKQRELAKAIKRVAVGGVVEGLATDPGVPHDIRAWCRSTGNELVSMDSQKDFIRFLVQRKK